MKKLLVVAALSLFGVVAEMQAEVSYFKSIPLAVQLLGGNEEQKQYGKAVLEAYEQIKNKDAARAASEALEAAEASALHELLGSDADRDLRMKIFEQTIAARRTINQKETVAPYLQRMKQLQAQKLDAFDNATRSSAEFLQLWRQIDDLEKKYEVKYEVREKCKAYEEALGVDVISRWNSITRAMAQAEQRQLLEPEVLTPIKVHHIKTERNADLIPARAKYLRANENILRDFLDLYDRVSKSEQVQQLAAVCEQEASRKAKDSLYADEQYRALSSKIKALIESIEKGPVVEALNKKILEVKRDYDALTGPMIKSEEERLVKPLEQQSQDLKNSIEAKHGVPAKRKAYEEALGADFMAKWKAFEDAVRAAPSGRRIM